MPGPHDAAGIKMLLHDSRETPSVHSLGQAVATGTHGLVGVKYLLVRKSNRCTGVGGFPGTNVTTLYVSLSKSLIIRKGRTDTIFVKCLDDILNLSRA